MTLCFYNKAALRRSLTGFLLHLILGDPHRTTVSAEADRAVCKQDLQHTFYLSASHLFVCSLNYKLVPFYLNGAVFHVSDHSSFVGDGAGQLFGEGEILKGTCISPPLKRETLPHHYTPVWSHKHSKLITVLLTQTTLHACRHS